MSDALVNAMREYCDEKHNWIKMRAEWIPYYRYIEETFDRCVCGQQVKEMCLIQHRRTGVKLYVGNKCIDQFNTTALCSNCHIYPLEKNTHAVCEPCRRKDTRPSGELLFGQYKGKSYTDVFESDGQFCLWVLKTRDYRDKHFREYLKRKYYEINGRDYQDERP